MLKNSKKTDKKGFTIIEVVLVLAIAGLIFLMVFVALPALQRSQRDTQRRDDMARFMSQLSQYQSNNGGKVPSDGSGNQTADVYNTFITNYLKVGKDSFVDPSTGSDYKVVDFTTCESGQGGCPNKTGNNAELGEISIYRDATCEGENPSYVQGDRKIALTIKLEGAGIYCGHN